MYYVRVGLRTKEIKDYFIYWYRWKHVINLFVNIYKRDVPKQSF